MNRLIELCSVLILSLLLITSCGETKTIPDGFTEQSYKDFTTIYNNYQEKVKKNSFEKESKGFALLFNYQKKNENGKLSKIEQETADKLGELLFIYNGIAAKKENKFPSKDVELLNDMVAADEYKIPKLEEEIESLLQLPKTNKTDIKESNVPNKQEENTNQKTDPVDNNVSAENCPKPYTQEECKQFEEYYKYGDGRFEPRK
ncbi:TPA: hypothetical protein ACGW5B_005537 [Bacillus paranthracis]|uniref:hypothetical protein n=1 Tax=unclassified Bacillus cereus group TaxID=2750818 RepID=UPI00027CCB31|nr:MULTISPECIES: hypothetical protein [unclassified Bacillus cereus group]AFQ13285.1 hypothetical protein BCK_27383 [Bacillus cereus FRI-35]MDX5839895.1 hypothetical protein [Bacillus cereus group sp. BfR-BA-01700]MDX5846240.1 hypothetical protein [Bacillus cereus group sp. BfR-BA-01233]MDX5941846.1 hypothetical protein [Bacillus cereus group sp. BfR-BA-00415]